MEWRGGGGIPFGDITSRQTQESEGGTRYSHGMKIPQPILLLFMLRPRGFQDFLRGGTLLFSRGRLWWSRRGKPPCNPYFSPRSRSRIHHSGGRRDMRKKEKEGQKGKRKREGMLLLLLPWEKRFVFSVLNSPVFSSFLCSGAIIPKFLLVLGRVYISWTPR